MPGVGIPIQKAEQYAELEGGKIEDIVESGFPTAQQISGVPKTDPVPTKGVILPSGLIVYEPPPGFLEFMVGIQANESGFDYARPQGSAGGAVGTPSEAVGGGYGAYQFTGGEQSSDAASQNWSPLAQDKIATDMVLGYYHQYGGASNPNVWADVTEAWYGPGTVGTSQNDVLTNPNAPSGPDWSNVDRLLKGDTSILPAAWIYGPAGGGVPASTIKKEVQNQHGADNFISAAWDATGGKVVSAVGSVLGDPEKLLTDAEQAVERAAVNIAQLLVGTFLIIFGLYMVYRELSGTSAGATVRKAVGPVKRVRAGRAKRQAATVKSEQADQAKADRENRRRAVQYKGRSSEGIGRGSVSQERESTVPADEAPF